MAAQRKHGHGVVPKQSRSDESIRITTTTTTNYYNNNNNPVKQTIAPAPASPSFSPSSDGTAWSIHVDRDIRPMDPTKRSRQAKLDAVAFFLSGIVNNVVYVVFLSAAADMLQGTQGVPKSVGRWFVRCRQDGRLFRVAGWAGRDRPSSRNQTWIEPACEAGQTTMTYDSVPDVRRSNIAVRGSLSRTFYI